jgi:formylglycine-generating enzyme required for sulfatase activity
LAAKKAWKKAKCPIVEKPINNELIFNLLVKQSDDIAYRKELGIYPKHQPSGSFISKPVLSSDECSKRSYIYHLSGNVSEWIHADYKTNYSNYEHFLLENLKDIPERDSILAWREYFNKRSVNSKGKWVMGANWYDRRVPSKNTNHYSAMYAKCFVNPDEQYATIGFRYVIRVRLKDEEKAFQKIEILGRNLPQMDYSMIKEEFNSKDDSEKWYKNDIPGFLFIPMGSYNKNGKTVSVQAAYAQETEVTNFQWMLFLNDLIDNGREEELKECIPNDKQWAEKMSLEDDSLQANWKSVKNKSSLTTFPGKFIRKNNINEIVLPSFAVKPIVGISHKAAMIYAQWLSEKYGFEKRAFRLPTDIEWQWMARGGKRDSNLAFVWGGPYTRSSSGVFLANFLVSDLYYDLDSVKVDNFDLYYANKYAHKQNLEHTSDEVLKLKTDFFSIRFTVVAHFPPNDYGLVDMCGNAAEMLNEPTHTKGGSWASPAFYIRIDKEEKWNGKPSDCVGFRLVRSYL